MRLPTKTSFWFYLVLLAVLLGSCFPSVDNEEKPLATPTPTEATTPSATPSASPSPKVRTKAIRVLEKLPIKGRAAKTGYARELFADDWEYSLGCDTRNRILKRDLLSYTLRSGSSCIVESGVLFDPYTAREIYFQRGVVTSLDVQIDHVVSLSDAWQKGAQKLSGYERFRFYNDPLNLLAVDGSANSQKSDSDAASWLPPNKSFRCSFVARQIAVKQKYGLWVTQAEADTIRRVLESCPKQRIPKG